ncbi:MAG: DUF4912 domain-containing protein [Myxacorys californica WJT36-NPBG1]|jgi:hypothetical protein|nr:DUF4912 domain-containing protein [Myxacorys californica WJT36-NPBG1]
MVFKKQPSVINLALLVTLLTTATPFAGSLKVRPALAQSASPSAFSLPNAVPKGTTVRISGSSSMAAINQALKQRFETQYPETSINVGYTESATGLQELRDGKTDLAAIGRPLTAEEKAQGLVAIPVTRNKIAIVVSPTNPFRGNLTTTQFAQIFRGEITDWSQVGGAPGAIRLIDRPDTSDTRQAFQNYPAFQATSFASGATATKTREDSTEAMLQDLGTNGIGYAIANQLVNQPSVRIVPMHTTLPDDPRYPFSQPLSYVYKGTPSPAIAAFLGYATSPAAQSIIQTAQADPAAASGALTAPPSPGASPAGATATGSAVAAVSPSAAATAVSNGSNQSGQAPQTTSEASAGLPTWLLWLLPLGIAGLLVAWLLKNRRSGSDPISSAEAPLVNPPVNPPDRGADPNLAARTETVINGDRASIAESQPEANQIGGTAIGGAGLAAGAGAAWIASRDRAELNEANPDPLASAINPSDRPVSDAPLASDSSSTRFVANPADNPSLGAVADPWDSSTQDAAQITSNSVSDPAVAPIDSENQTVDRRENAIDTASDARSDIDPAIVQESSDISGFAPLGGAAMAGAGAAWIGSGNQSSDHSNAIPDNSSEIEESLVSFDLIEEIDDLEAQLADDQVDELVLDDDAATIEPTEPSNNFDLQVSVGAESQQAVAPNSEASPDDLSDSLGAGSPGLGAALGGAAVGVAAASSSNRSNAIVDRGEMNREQTEIEATKFNLGQAELSRETLASVDEGLADLPAGYSESRIVLMPRDPQWAYAYWDVPNDHREALRRQGGQRLALRLYDVTDVTLDRQSPHSLQQYDCEELARDWYVPIPVSDRDYLAEIGYLTEDGRWLMLARSAPVSIPPVYPSDWFEDQFVTIDWEEELQGKTFLELVPPGRQSSQPQSAIYDQIFGLAQGVESQRVAGSLFGSMQQVPETAISSFVFPSGMGGWALPTPSGMGMSGALTMSGLTMSGAGFSGGVAPIRPRKFWLVADAELIVYGATEPDATLTIAGEPVELSPDGTFRFQMSFQDGLIDYPIMAVASDGVQTRSIHLKFNRETPSRNTNTKEDATDEWLS